MLNIEQVQEWNLARSYKIPTKNSNGKAYDKLAADPRGKRFIKKYGELFQVEIDAVDPALLPELVQ